MSTLPWKHCKTLTAHAHGSRSSEKIKLVHSAFRNDVLEPMTELYRYTGDKKYLDFCNHIIKTFEYDNGPKIISTLTSTEKVDKIADAKAYEMMSNFTGMVKLYQLTGDQKLLEPVQSAWNDISKYKLYITGTASEGECYTDGEYN